MSSETPGTPASASQGAEEELRALADDLDGALNVDRHDLTIREASLFDDVAGATAGRIVLFGAGRLGRKVVDGLAGTGLEALCFSDNNEAMWGDVIDGTPVLPPREAIDLYGDTAAFVVTVHLGYQTIEAQLRALGARVVMPFFVLLWRHPARFLPHYAHDLPHRVLDAAPEIREAANLLSDAASHREYNAQVRWRLDPSHLTGTAGTRDDLYFPGDLITLGEKETFIDCGAFDGDTLQTFVARVNGAFEYFHAFEPDPRNLTKLSAAVDRLPEVVRKRVRVEGAALGSSQGTVWLSQHDAASVVGTAGDVPVRCDTLDHLVADVAPTFVKMDIEGAEREALLGARATIEAFRPVLAISAYHTQDDLWQLPLVIASIAPDYRFHYRRHTAFPDDDLVLYALPPGR